MIIDKDKSLLHTVFTWEKRKYQETSVTPSKVSKESEWFSKTAKMYIRSKDIRALQDMWKIFAYTII